MPKYAKRGAGGALSAFKKDIKSKELTEQT